jgi:colicin import membrane protein
MWKMIRENPRAVVYAVLMHVVLLIVLVFSLDWTPKITRPAGVKVPIEAKLVDQRKLDAIEEQKQAEQRKLETERKAAEDKKKAEAERKKQAEAERKKQAAEQKQRAEAERKKKALLAEKKKKEQEVKRKAEAEKKKQAAAEKKKQAAAEKKKQAAAEKQRKVEAEAKRKAAAEKQRKAEEAARRREAEQALQQQLAAEQAARDQGIVAEYTAYIQEKIQQNWRKPAGSPEGLSCTVQVSLIPGGDVARVQIVRSSGDPLFDRSVENAVHKAAPMPLPRDPAVFKYFRELRLIFKPR